MQSNRSTGFIEPIFLPLKTFLKIAFLTFLVVLELLGPNLILIFCQYILTGLKSLSFHLQTNRILETHFLPLKTFLKIGLLTFLVVLEPLGPEFDSDFLSVYSNRS